jgi:hypothetical protein
MTRARRRTERHGALATGFFRDGLSLEEEIEFLGLKKVKPWQRLHWRRLSRRCRWVWCPPAPRQIGGTDRRAGSRGRTQPKTFFPHFLAEVVNRSLFFVRFGPCVVFSFGSPVAGASAPRATSSGPIYAPGEWSCLLKGGLGKPSGHHGKSLGGGGEGWRA